MAASISERASCLTVEGSHPKNCNGKGEVLDIGFRGNHGEDHWFERDCRTCGLRVFLDNSRKCIS